VSRTNYERAAGRDGGNGLYRQAVPNIESLEPTIQRDAELLTMLFVKMRKDLQRQHIDGRKPTMLELRSWWWIKSFYRDFCKRPTRLSQRVLDICVSRLGLDGVPAVKVAAVPLGLRGPLPKRPPTPVRGGDS